MDAQLIRPPLRRASFRAVAVAIFLTVSTVTAAPHAAADEYADQDTFLALTNEARAWEGAAPLSIDGELQGLAEWWAWQLRDADVLAHNPELPYQVNWWAWGENVGWGYSVDDIHAALVNSPSHYWNMVDHVFTHVGIAVAYTGHGAMYVVMVFGG